MTVLLDQAFDRTLDALVARFAEGHRGTRIEAWVFEDEAARRDAEARLAEAGVEARIRCAYKPLVHFFLEEVSGPFDTVTVHVPAPVERFRLEAFPLAGMLGVERVRFAAGEEALHYRVVIARDGGTEEHRVFAPNRQRADHLGQTTLGPAGWLRVWRDGAAVEDAALLTEYEAVYAAAMGAIRAHPWPATSPYFAVLEIAANIPGIERRLGWHDECVSAAEGLHEEFYFSLLELFQRHAGLGLGDRSLQPGQIVPDIRNAKGPAHVRVALVSPPAIGASDAEETDLASAGEPLTPGQIRVALDGLGGAPVTARSVQGRVVEGRLVDGAGPGFVITGGQHANETTGVVGALRAARELREQGARFVVIPQENPDGYALHFALRRGNPRHMLHAARYTALGDDLQRREKPPLHEKEARLAAFRLVEAGLHINLHGYPAHEWNRPLTGYIPRGFEKWMMPLGFYLILHHPKGRQDQARAFLEALTARVMRVPGLAALNASQLAAAAAHAGQAREPVINGIHCVLTEADDAPVPYTLITEYPDETIYGDDFRLGHAVQTATVLEAAALYRAGALPQP
jgi:hypothetical protein